MSRGSTTPHAGNLSHSMRQNYEEHGVEQYYKQVGRTYRNPHFQGVRSCLFSWFTRWWEKEQDYLINTPDDDRVLVLDLACGSGEVTLAFAEWWQLGKMKYADLTVAPNSTSATAFPRRKAQHSGPPPLAPGFPPPQVTAADPYTSAAFTERTSFSCSSHSFKDIAEGALPQIITDLSSHQPITDINSTSSASSTTLNSDPPLTSSIEATIPSNEKENNDPTPHDQIESSTESRQYTIEMVICSFALHLVESPSELFSLLWELSTKARWLVVLAPHKKPEIKDGWGWTKWNVDTWAPCSMSEQKGEILIDRVHCRIYRSTAL